MRPYRASTIWRCTARVNRKTLFRFTSRTASHSSSLILNTRLSRVIPALLTRMSVRPKRDVPASTVAPTCSRPETSHPNAAAWPPAASIRWTTGEARSASTSTTATRAPSDASRSAVAWPIPCAAPVTTATRSVNLLMCSPPACPLVVEDDEAARSAARLEIGERRGDAVQSNPRAHERFEVQPSGPHVLEQHWNITRGVAGAEHAAGQRAREVRDLQRIEGDRVALGSHSDDGRVASAPGDRPGGANSLRATHAFNGVVSTPAAGERAYLFAQVRRRLEHIGCPQPSREISLVRRRIHRDDRRRAGDARALQRRQSDTPESEHDDRLPGRHAGGVQHRAHTREHGATEQRSLLEGDVVRYQDACVLGDNGLGGESGNAETGVHLRAVGKLRIRMRGRVARVHAEVWLFVRAKPALPARGCPVEQHGVALPEAHVASRRHHAPCPLMAEHRREQLHESPASQREVAVTDARRGQLDPHLAGFRVGKRDRLHLRLFAARAHDRGARGRHGSCTDLITWNSSRPYRPSSRPVPDCLYPPNGAMRLKAAPLMSTCPVRRRRATAIAWSGSLDHTEPLSP